MKEIITVGNKNSIDEFVFKIKRKKPLFICVIGNTETAKIPGISAAGVNPEITDYTPAADMEYLMYETCKSIRGIPMTPEGIPSPALITKASLNLANIPFIIAVGGLKVYPQTPFLEFGGTFGKDISNGCAISNIQSIYEKAKYFGSQISKVVDYLVIGESIPGGTTTALGVLTAMGYDVSNKISSSLAENPIALKLKTVRSGMLKAKLKPGDLKYNPLDAISFLGDPMQPVHVGITIGASENIPVILAGGTQMAAILAIINAIKPSLAKNLAIGTTRWILEDKNTDLKGIVDQINPEVPIFGCNLNFSKMKYDGLRAYERFVVKEGVGAGGSTIAAILSLEGKLSINHIQDEIEKEYSKLIEFQ